MNELKVPPEPTVEELKGIVAGLERSNIQLQLKAVEEELRAIEAHQAFLNLRGPQLVAQAEMLARALKARSNVVPLKEPTP